MVVQKYSLTNIKTFKINHLATCICAEDKGKVVFGRVRSGDTKLGWLSLNFKDCHNDYVWSPYINTMDHFD